MDKRTTALWSAIGLRIELVSSLLPIFNQRPDSHLIASRKYQFHIIAEGLRAFVEANDPASHWPRATRVRLQAVDPEMFKYVERLFDGEFRAAARVRPS
jgi:hypothetical protein